MTIQFIKRHVDNGTERKPGEVVRVPSFVGLHLIQKGVARPHGPPPIEKKKGRA
jgi:hypothetical protein